MKPAGCRWRIPTPASMTPKGESRFSARPWRSKPSPSRLSFSTTARPANQGVRGRPWPICLARSPLRPRRPRALLRARPRRVVAATTATAAHAAAAALGDPARSPQHPVVAGTGRRVVGRGPGHLVGDPGNLQERQGGRRGLGAGQRRAAGRRLVRHHCAPATRPPDGP